MGKNVLKSPGLVPENSSSSRILRLTAFIVVLIAGVVRSADGEDVRMKILKELNMTRIPRVSQWNISQTEYEVKHREYFDLVEQNQRRRLNASLNYDEENIVRQKLYTFSHSGLKNSQTHIHGLTHLNYNVYIPEESGRRVEVQETSLRFLLVFPTCTREWKTIRLRVVKTGEGTLLTEQGIALDSCLPKWIGLDLVTGVTPNLKAFPVNLTVLCDDCVAEGVDVTQPHLNVIVRARARTRRRRAEKKKRRRFPGKCVRHPWEVDLGKLKGYEYIVQPRKFDAGLCAGRCTGQWNLATQHSNLQYLFSNIDKTIPKPCCAPSKMESLEILYPDEDNPRKLKVSVWNDTKIVECACS